MALFTPGVKKIKGAAYKNGDFDGTYKHGLMREQGLNGRSPAASKHDGSVKQDILRNGLTLWR